MSIVGTVISAFILGMTVGAILVTKLDTRSMERSTKGK